MLDRIWDFLMDSLITCFLPLVYSYHAICSSVLINTADGEATGLEWVADQVLSPTQYLFAGKIASRDEKNQWIFSQRFDYKHDFWLKSISSLLCLPPSFVLGTMMKGISFLDPKAKQRYVSMVEEKRSFRVLSQREHYQKLGLQLGEELDLFIGLNHKRRPGDENTLREEKKALSEVAHLLNKAGIPWWVDCGTCLGAYRYGGVIPWDGDIDIAVLLPDFHNVLRVLNQLDPTKYIVQDWSSRDFPDSYIKIFIRKSGVLIDIYHFQIDEKKRELSYILSLENHLFFPEWWKERERKFKEPVSFDTVFPLKRANFDGIEVFVPNDPQKYLQRYYGENLDPVKIYDPKTGSYEKDLSHPYWQKAYAH